MNSRSDPTLVRNQPSLSTSSGFIWMLVGALLAAVAGTELAILFLLRGSAVALAGAVIVLVLYAGMIVVRVFVKPLRLRLRLLAIGLAAVALAALVFVYITALVELSL